MSDLSDALQYGDRFFCFGCNDELVPAPGYCPRCEIANDWDDAEFQKEEIRGLIG